MSEIRILKKNEGFCPGGAWWDNHVGETFPLVRVVDGVPPQYEVDISKLRARGEWTVSRAYVPTSYYYSELLGSPGDQEKAE